MPHKKTLIAVLVSLVLAASGCAEDDPKPSGLDGRSEAGTDASDGGVADIFVDGQGGCLSWHKLVAPANNNKPSCVAEADEYQPANTANDTWPACISDDNTYHRVLPDISSIARVAGFEGIVAKLLVGAKNPTAQDFVDARVAGA